MASKEPGFFSSTTRSLARKLNSQVSRVRDPSHAFPVDVLSASEVQPQFLQHIGFPESADSVAYEPVQKLLAVATSDGRVKIIGRAGVEATLLGDSTAPTKYLGFLRHRGALLRITQDGNVQLFSVPGRRLLASVWIEEDSVNVVAAVPGGPYVMLGCASGNCRVVLVSSRGGASGGEDPAAGLAIQPYQVLGEDLDASGPVVALAIARNEDRPLALIVHRNSGPLVWDLRAERVVCAAPDDEEDPSKPTCACWVGDRANCFAVGYDDGSILVWGVPAPAVKGRSAASQDAVLVMSLRVVPEATAAAPVLSVAYMPGAEGTPGGEDCLLVCGGQAATDPDMLTLVPLDPEGATAPLTVPWFGTLKAHALMPKAGSVAGSDAPESLMVLTEGGQLVVHDLKEWHPYPLSLPFQELPPITTSAFVTSVSSELAVEAALGGPNTAPTAVQHTLTLDKLHTCARRPDDAEGRRTDEDTWPFTGGEPAAVLPSAVARGCHPSALLCTGHRDGRVRMWDTTAQVPAFLSSLPSASASGQERLRPVSSLAVCPVSGLMAVGHSGGAVRVYQFSDRPQAVRRATLDESLVPYDTLLAQPGGMQYVLKYSTHAADITAVALATRLQLLVVGDADGCVSVVDLMQPQRLFTAVPVQGSAVRSLAVGRIALGAGHAQAEADAGPLEDEVVFVATEDSSLAILSLRTGELVARPLRPKNTSTPLDLALLDVHGVPIFPSMGPVVLPWADNNAAAAPRSLKMMSTLSRGGGRSLGSEQTQADSVTASLRLPTANSLEVQELPTDTDDDDLDSHLDAAAAAADAETSTKGSKLRFSLFRRRSASPDKLQSAAKSVSSAQESSPTRTPAGSVAGRGTAVPEVHSAIGTPPTPVPSPYLEDPAGPGGFNGFSGHVEEEDIDTSADLWGQDKAAPHPDVQGFALEALQGEAVDYPFFAEAVGAEQVPTVCYVLLATAEYLRVYSVDTLLSGDRTTERKARLATPAIFAGWFLAEHGPGVATVSQSNVLSVHSVPNLEPLVTQQLAAPSALGFEWHSPGDAACTAWACSLDGQLLLTAPGNELVRLTTVKQCAVPVGAASTFDWDLAKAAKAAAAMVGDASPALGRGSRAASLDAPAPSPENGATSRGASFINSVKGAASGLVDSAAAATGAMRQEFDRVRGLPPRELPTLRALFEKPVTSLEEEDDIDFIPEEEESGRNSALGKAAGMAADAAGIAGEKAVAVAGKAKDLASAAMAGAVQQGAKLKNMIPNPMTKRSASIDEPEAPALEPTSKERRNELLGTPPTGYNRSRTPEPGSRGTSAPRPAASFGGYSSGGRRAPKLHKRTTSEIKREYGHSRAQDARAVMERNRALLAERGQKLANLEEKSAAMQNDAEDFAGLAQELEAAFANRKWWHF